MILVTGATGFVGRALVTGLASDRVSTRACVRGPKVAMLDRVQTVQIADISAELPAAANETFLVSDGEDLSTTELLRRMGRAMGRPAWLIPFPAALLRLGASMVNKPAIGQGLYGSLQVDIPKTKELLSWNPPLSFDEGLRKAAGGLSK